MPGRTCIAAWPETSRWPSHSSIARPAMPFSERRGARIVRRAAARVDRGARCRRSDASRSRIACTSGRTEPPRITPSVSRKTSFACFCTCGGNVFPLCLRDELRKLFDLLSHCRSFVTASIEFDPRVLDDLRPLRDFARSGIAGTPPACCRPASRLPASRARAWRASPSSSRSRALNCWTTAGGVAGGREQAEPADGFVVLDAGFRGRGHVRNRRRALARGDRERPQALGADLRDHRLERIERGRRFAAEHRRRRSRRRPCKARA